MARVDGGGLRCKDCFCREFEGEIWDFVSSTHMLPPRSRICVCVSGGKDSAVLLHVLHLLNQQQQQQWELLMLAIDEGIEGYRDHALKTVEANSRDYGLPLKILSYHDLYKGWTMDRIHKAVSSSPPPQEKLQQQQQQQQQQQEQGGCSNSSSGSRSIVGCSSIRRSSARTKEFTSYCTYCGVFRRQAFERGAQLLGASCLATGHNLDDCAETTLLNLTRGDSHRLRNSARGGSTISSSNNNSSSNRQVDDIANALKAAVVDAGGVGDSSSIKSSSNNSSSSSDSSSSSSSSSYSNISNSSSSGSSSIRRCKPLMHCFQKEIVLYAHFRRLQHFATECTYSFGATRGKPRELLTALQAALQPQRVQDIVRAATSWLSLPPHDTNSSIANSSNSNTNRNAQKKDHGNGEENTTGQQQQQEGPPSPKERGSEGGALRPCRECGALTTNPLCRACKLVDLLQHQSPTAANVSARKLKIMQEERVQPHHLTQQQQQLQQQHPVEGLLHDAAVEVTPPTRAAGPIVL